MRSEINGYVVEKNLKNGGKWCRVELFSDDVARIGYAEQRDTVVENIWEDVWLVCPDWKGYYEVPNALYASWF